MISTGTVCYRIQLPITFDYLTETRFFESVLEKAGDALFLYTKFWII